MTDTHPQPSSTNAGQQITSGTGQMLMAQALNVPLGIITNALLTRTLGPEMFGWFVLCGSIVTWFEIIAVRTLTRASVKLITEAEDWQQSASQLFQVQVLLSMVVTAVLYVAAPWIAAALSTESLTPYLRILALQIPFSAMVRVHESAMIGRKRFGARALNMGLHGVLRLIFVVVLLGAGYSLAGALISGVLAVMGQFLLARVVIAIPLRFYRTLPTQIIGRYAVPLFLYTICISLYQHMDVILVKLLSSSDTATGYYGAAKSLMTMPGMISVAFSPLLLSVLTTLWQQGDSEGVRGIVKQTVRLHLIMLPFIALAAGSASEIITFLYSTAFLPAAPIMAWLVFGGLASMLHSTMTASLTAIGKPALTFWITLPMIPAHATLTFIAIPLLGPLGAAISSTLIFAAGSLAAYAVLAHSVGARFPIIGRLRMLALGIVGYGLGRASHLLIPAHGPLLIGKLLILCAVLAALLLLTAELKPVEVRFIFEALRQSLSRVRQAAGTPIR